MPNIWGRPKMRMLKSKKGAYAIAVALIVLLIIILILTANPAAKQTVIDIVGAATAKVPVNGTAP